MQETTAARKATAAVLGGTKQQEEADYARLRGEYDAIQQAAIARKCDMDASVLPTAATSAGAAR